MATVSFMLPDEFHSAIIQHKRAWWACPASACQVGLARDQQYWGADVWHSTTLACLPVWDLICALLVYDSGGIVVHIWHLASLGGSNAKIKSSHSSTRKMKKAYPWLLPNPQYWRYLHRVVRWQEETWQDISHPGWTFPAWVAACLLIMAVLAYQNIGAKNTVNSVMYWRYGKFCHGWTNNAILGIGRRKHKFFSLEKLEMQPSADWDWVCLADGRWEGREDALWMRAMNMETRPRRPPSSWQCHPPNLKFTISKIENVWCSCQSANADECKRLTKSSGCTCVRSRQIPCWLALSGSR